MGKILDKFFMFEDKVKNWIENNKIKWCFILFFVGILLGIVAGIFLGGNFIGKFIFGFALVIVELFAGGSGIDEVRNDL